MKKNEILQIYGTDYKEMTKALCKRAQLAQSIRAKAGCLPSPLIGIKPNLVSPTPASFGATTHPEIAAGIIEYLQENHFTNIIICEGSWVGDKTEDAFEYCGYRKLAEEYHVKLFDTQKDTSYPSRCRDLELRICSIVRKIDFLINIPVVKGHCQTKVTCALKNMKGLIPNSEKRRFHSLGLHKPIACLNQCIRQDFIVIDNICGDPFFEDGGNPFVRNCIMAARDPVLADVYACHILNVRVQDVPYISLAAGLGVGSASLVSRNIITLSSDEQGSFAKGGTGACTADQTASSEDGGNARNADLSGSPSRYPLELNYATQEIESCSACYSALTNALDELNQKGHLQRLTDDLHYKFCIGQGYKGTSCSDSRCIGIGSCTGGFMRNVPGCPPASEEILKYLTSLL